MELNLETPVLLLDDARMQHNIERMQARMNALGVAFRPHVKTSKCLEVARRQLAAGARGITVSTLKEAEQFFAAGVNDKLAFNQANQEHGVLQWTGGEVDLAARYPVGSSLRIVPNHACATGAQHPHYYVVPHDGGEVRKWERFSGW